MSLIQFWRILWVWRWLILSTAMFCMLGGVVATFLLPPRWKADAHVYLNLLKPDPVTGEVIAGPSTRAYVATQVELITDYSVVGQAVDKLGWLSDPDLIQQYENRSKNDTRDFRRWLAQIIVDRTKANVIDNSNILEISYTGSSAASAKAVADALMQSYLDASLAFKRAEAIKSAEWYAREGIKAKKALEDAETSETAYERANGVVMQDDKTDVDSARLAAMAGQGGGTDASGSNSVDGQIAEVDAAIQNATATLGPNHPELQSLRAKRASLAAMAARGGASPSGASRIDAQKALVISKRDKLARLRTLQTEVDIRRDLYNKTSQKEVDFRQQAAITDAGLSALGNAAVPQSPSFPNKPLILGGSLALGFALGLLLSLLIELLNRRVRGAEDLRSALGIPVLAVLGAAR